MRKRTGLIISAIVIILIAIGCSANPVKTVNQQLYPYLVVNTAGEIRVAKGAALSELYIPDDVYIDGKKKATVFMGYQDPADKAALESVTIGSGITEISDGAFKDAGSLSNVSFGDDSKLTSIGASAFQNTGLTSITLPETPVAIGESAFADNASLEKVDLGGSASIGENAFSGNTGLASVDFGSVSSIGDGAFTGAGLTEVVLPEHPVIIGENAFQGNEKLESVDFGGTTVIGDGAFSGNANLTNADFSSVTEIGDEAFRGTGLKEVVFPEDCNVTIGKDAFRDNASLEKVDLGGAKEVGSGAFMGNSSLTDLDLGKVEEIGTNAFSGSDLGSVYIPSSVDRVMSGAFSNSNITSVTVNGGNTTISTGAFNGNTVTAISIPAVMTPDAKDIFKDALERVTVTGGGSRGDTVAKDSLSNLPNLTYVSVNGVETIAEGAFQGNTALTDVNLGRGLETIGKDAFKDAGTENTKYVIPATVNDAVGAFDEDDDLELKFEISLSGNYDSTLDFTVPITADGKPNTEDNVATIIRDQIKNLISGDKYVDSITAPGKDGNTTEYHNDIYRELEDLTINAVLPGSDAIKNEEGSENQFTINGLVDVDLINRYLGFEKGNEAGDHFVAGMVGTTNETVDIPTEYRGKPVTEIADGGFKGNVDVNIPEDTNINKVGDNAFQNNTRLDPEDFANLSGGYTDSEGSTNKGVTDIGEGAFQGATGIATSEGQEDGLKNITIPENATTVGKDAFKDTGAEKITIPAEKEGNGDRNYNPGAFGPSDSLKKVVVEGPSTDLTGTEIAEAFGDNNRNVESLTIPADLIDTEDEVNALKEAFPNLKELIVTPSANVSDDPAGNLAGFDKLESVTLPSDLLAGREEGILSGSDSVKNITVTPGDESNGDAATIIPEGAFNGLDSLTTVTVDDGITAIGSTPRKSGSTTSESGAFAGCDNLTSVTVPSTLDKIGDGTFEGCGKLEELKQTDENGNLIPTPDYTVPEGIEEIGENAFKDTAFDKVILPPGIDSVGSGAFDVNGTIEEAVIPAHLANQRDENGKNDSDYNSRPNTDGSYPTKGISSIFISEPSDNDDTVTIGNLTIVLGDGEGHGTVPGVTDGDANTTLGAVNSIIPVTEDLKKEYGDSLVYVDEEKQYVVNPEPEIVITGDITIDDGITVLGPGALANVGVGSKDDNLTVSLPDDLEEIGTGAFQNAPLAGYEAAEDGGKDSVTGGLIINGNGVNDKLPESVESLGDNAFKDSGLISSDGTTINPGEFIENVDAVGNSALEGIDIGEEFTISDNIDSLETISDIYGSIEGVTSLTVPIDLIDTADEAKELFDTFPNLKDLTITGSTNSTGDIYGLNQWGEKLESVDLSESGATGIQIVGTTGEEKLSNLSTVVLPDTLESIGDSVFEGCTSLESISYKDGGTVVEDKLPPSITNIGENAFKDSSLGKGQDNYGGTLHNDGKADAYIDGGLLSEIEGELTIGAGAFEGTSIGPVLNIPAGTTSIGEGAFKDIVNGEANGDLDVQLPAAVTGNIDDVFTGPEGHDESVFIDNLIITGNTESGETTVGQLAGENPNMDHSAAAPKNQAELVLDNVVIKDGVTGIGVNAFVGVGVEEGESLDVTLPEDLETIGDHAFGSDDKNGALLTVDNSGTILEISDSTGVEKPVLTIDGDKLPSSVDEIGAGAFQNSGILKEDKENPINISEFVPSGVVPGEDAFAGINIGSEFTISDNIDSVEDIQKIYGDVIESVEKLTVPLDLVSPDYIDELKSTFPNVKELIVTPTTGEKTMGSVAATDDGAWSGLVSVDLSESGVVVIADEAFSDVADGFELKLPSTDGGTITSVGKDAFSGVGSLITNDVFEDSFGKLETIGDGAFAGAAIGPELVIPNTVTSIGSGAFAGINGGTSSSDALKVTLPANAEGDKNLLENIDDYFTTTENHEVPVFIGELTITSGNNNVVGQLAGIAGDSAQEPNTEAGDPADLVLNKVVIGTGVTGIGDNAFVGVGVEEGESLDVTLPEDLKTIGEHAFGSDDKNGALLTVDNSGTILDIDSTGVEKPVITIDGDKLPSSVGVIGAGAFENSGLASDDGSPIDISDFISDLASESGVAIGDEAFVGVNVGDIADDPRTTITIPGSVTDVGEGAFAVVDNNGDYIVSNEPGIDVVLPNTAINKDVGLDNIFLPSGERRPAHFGTVTVTPGKNNDSSFDTSNLTGKDDSRDTGVDIILDEIVVDDGIKDVTISDFENVGVRDDEDDRLYVTIPDNVDNVTIGTGLGNGPKVAVGTGTGYEIGEIYFREDGTLPSTENGITIAENAFSQDAGQSGSSYPANDVGDPFWSGDPSDGASVNTDEIVNVKEIGSGAFQNNENVKRITIPKECVSIGENAFAGCTNLEEIIFEGPRETPIEIAENAFSGCSSLKYISTIEGNKYEKGDEGTAVIPEKTITDFESGVFAGTGFTAVTLPGDINSVANDAFSNAAGNDVTYTVTVPVDGFMNVTEYPEGGVYPTEDAEVTFTGTFGESGKITGISATIGDSTVSEPQKFGYTADWKVGTVAVDENAAITVDELINNGKGPAVTWNADTYTGVTIKLPEGYGFADKTGTVKQDTLTVDLTFGESIADAIASAIKNAVGDGGVIINNETGKYVDPSKLQFPDGVADASGNLIKDLSDDKNITLTIPESSAQDFNYPITIVKTDGTTLQTTVTKGTTWTQIAEAGISEGTFVSTIAPDQNSGKFNGDTSSLIAVDSAVTVPAGAPPYYNYAKVALSGEGVTPGDVYYKVGSSADVFTPNESAGAGYDWAVSADTSVISADNKIVGSGSVTVSKKAHEYKVTVDNVEQGNTVTFGKPWSEYGYAPSGNNGYMLSSSVSGNGPFADEQVIGSGSNTTVAAQTNNGDTIALTSVTKIPNDIKVTGDGFDDITIASAGWYKADGTIQLPEAPDLPVGKEFKGWLVNGELKEPGDSVSVYDIQKGVSASIETKNTYTVQIDGKGVVTVVEGESWSKYMTDISSSDVEYWLNGTKLTANDVVGNLGTTTVTIDKKLKVTYKAPSGTTLIPYDQIGNSNPSTVSSTSIWVDYETSVDAIKESPVVKYQGGIGTQFDGWNYSQSSITEPLDVSSASSTPIETGIDIANPNYLYLNIGGDQYVFYMAKGYATWSEYNGMAASYNTDFKKLDNSIAETLLTSEGKLSDEQRKYFSAWMKYWKMHEPNTISSPTTVAAWIDLNNGQYRVINVDTNMFDPDLRQENGQYVWHNFVLLDEMQESIRIHKKFPSDFMYETVTHVDDYSPEKCVGVPVVDELLNVSSTVSCAAVYFKIM